MIFLNSSKERTLQIFFFCSISIHLFAEVIRRFFYFSNNVYLVADVFLILSAILVIKRGSLSFDRILSALLYVYVFWGTFSLAYSGVNIGLLLVGVRPIILSCLACIVSMNYFFSYKNANYFLIKVITFWAAIILSVAILQIAFGASASINMLPDAMNTEFGGRGDYTGNNGSIAWLFRPTSIFMHTGRLGQYSFFLGLVLILPMLLDNQMPKKYWLGAMLSIFLVLVSGQRAAGVFLASSCALAVFRFSSKKGLLRAVLFSAIGILFLLILSAELRDVVVGRFASGFTGSLDRVVDMTKHWEVSFLRYPVFGNGLGFFSFGGSSFGGQIYYEYMRLFGGGGENSWLRIQGETGIPGLFLFACMIALLSIKSYKRARIASKEDCSVHLASALLAFFSAFWAFTHDVYGNYLFLMPMFLLFGASSGLAKRKVIIRVLNAQKAA